MKKLILTISLATVMLLGCKKEDGQANDCAEIQNKSIDYGKYMLYLKQGSVSFVTYEVSKDAYNSHSIGSTICGVGNLKELVDSRSKK